MPLRLEYFRVGDHRVSGFVLKNVGSLVEADISLDYDKSFDPNDGKKRNMIRGFLVGISKVKDMTIASTTLEVIYEYSRYEPFRVEFYGDMWEMLPVFLESCPNLKSLVACLLSSLEYVEIDGLFKGEAMEMKLVSYLLENSKILKKMTLFLNGSREREESAAILKELLTIPRLSTSFQVLLL
ncbi:hypothetical protein F2Q69_00051848 [Brassica cretica]|uniref:FBD domain-containing protein n=1 Tax=Brassica cretica TaxID=69181 RepID=A0A8S9PSI6_BRACR|nr:hypothetical protein F2Q69_00051848 [Brassica cretica]